MIRNLLWRLGCGKSKYLSFFSVHRVSRFQVLAYVEGICKSEISVQYKVISVSFKNANSIPVGWEANNSYDALATVSHDYDCL